MKALVAREPGEADVLTLTEVEPPRPDKGEMLVRVMACALNPVDYKIRRGYLSETRSWPAILGFDVAGIVEETGPGVEGCKKGDEVFYFAGLAGPGAYAEYHLAPSRIVAPAPGGLSFVEAASLPLAGTTAWQALFAQGRLREGETLLVQGGAGGVGSLAIQLAKGAGVRVIATCSAGNRDYVQKLGADLVIDYERDDVAPQVEEATGGALCDMVFDTVGGETFFSGFDAVKPFGRIAFLNAFGKGSDMTRLNLARPKNISIIATLVQPSRKGLEVLSRAVLGGKLKPQVAQVISLDEVADGHRRLEMGHGRGKIVIDLSPEG